MIKTTIIQNRKIIEYSVNLVWVDYMNHAQLAVLHTSNDLLYVTCEEVYCHKPRVFHAAGCDKTLY